jgi:hypothetical protein
MRLVPGSWYRASPFMATAGLQRALTIRVFGVDNTELNKGQPVRSQRREHGCRKRWRGGVMSSYGRDTDDDEVQWSKELTVMGRRTRKLSVQHSTFAIAIREA